MSKLGLTALAAAAALFPATAASAEHPDAGPAGHWRDRPAHDARGGMDRMDPRRHHGRRFGHIPRIERGGMVPGFWFGPQFVVRNWPMYGFSQPFAGGRWIRYYDDALLIDRYGRVHDARYGWDWDRYGDRWGYDRRGVPVYVGDGDFEPDERDYEWAERWERGDRRGHGRGPDCSNPCTRTYHGPPPPMPGYGHGYGSGYGYGCGCGPVVVTETITTTAPVVEKVTYYEYVEEEVVTRSKARRPVRRAAPRRAQPRPGERG
jgi:Ni/Co efflux regulator RcnB